MPGTSPLRHAALVCGGLILVGCTADSPTPTDLAARVSAAPASALGGVAPSQVARALDDLRALTAPWHNPEKAAEAGYTFELGCIDERVVEGVTPELARGMGFHPANLDLLFDDEVDLLAPETLVYASDGRTGRTRLAAFDYFMPASAAWPSPDDGGTPPSLPEFGLPFTWSAAHGGWMFHVWLWWENPDGMFANFNPTVPRCACELSPETGTCIPG